MGQCWAPWAAEGVCVQVEVWVQVSVQAQVQAQVCRCRCLCRCRHRCAGTGLCAVQVSVQAQVCRYRCRCAGVCAVQVSVQVQVCRHRCGTWMRLLPQSATMMLPLLSTATPVGALNCPLPSPCDPNLNRNSPSALYTWWARGDNTWESWGVTAAPQPGGISAPACGCAHLH